MRSLLRVEKHNNNGEVVMVAAALARRDRHDLGRRHVVVHRLQTTYTARHIQRKLNYECVCPNVGA